MRKCLSKNIGYGLSIVNDKIGPSGNLEINLKGSYHKKLNRATLSFGGYVGMFSSSLNFDELIFVNPELNVTQTGSENQIALDFGAGGLDAGTVDTFLVARVDDLGG